MTRFRIRFEDREVDLPRGELIVGRGHDCHVRLRALSVSRRHLRLLVVANSVVAYDLDSRNGTYVNDVRQRGAIELDSGDRITVGSQSFQLMEVGPETEWEPEPDTWETTFKAQEAEEAEQAESKRDSNAARITRGFPSAPIETVGVESPVADMSEALGDIDFAPHPPAFGRQACSNCGSTFDLGLRYCPDCAAESYSAPRYRSCPSCKALLSEDDAVCPKCGLNRPATAPAPKDDERRTTTRQPASIRVLYVSSSLTFDADVSNISDGGLFIVADLLDPVGTQADVVLTTEDHGGARFIGEVAHVVSEDDAVYDMRAGMGVRFTEIEPDAQKWLDSYLEVLRA